MDIFCNSVYPVEVFLLVNFFLHFKEKNLLTELHNARNVAIWSLYSYAENTAIPDNRIPQWSVHSIPSLLAYCRWCTCIIHTYMPSRRNPLDVLQFLLLQFSTFIGEIRQLLVACTLVRELRLKQNMCNFSNKSHSNICIVSLNTFLQTDQYLSLKLCYS